ncbi:MAG: sigma 54-interacting transcriptional regulator, partial [Deltaproteobacteria bacterium]|nr:sigma 54-interacting transcriptional regulator [Deltaproteobacteria bacterium]
MEIVQFIPQYQRRLVFLASQADSAPVLVYGPNGSGKSALAQWIHNNSQRSTLPYIIAKKDIPLSKQIPAAHSGTFLLPEIGEWPLAEQKILSRLLETKAIPHPQHNSMPMVLNVRLMATTSQALE